jgi:hypothetical protein
LRARRCPRGMRGTQWSGCRSPSRRRPAGPCCCAGGAIPCCCAGGAAGLRHSEWGTRLSVGVQASRVPLRAGCRYCRSAARGNACDGPKKKTRSLLLLPGGKGPPNLPGIRPPEPAPPPTRFCPSRNRRRPQGTLRSSRCGLCAPTPTGTRDGGSGDQSRIRDLHPAGSWRP